jgi:primase-polymerase (primpol)-like protein
VPVKEVEIYASARYFTVTGARLEASPNEVAVVEPLVFGTFLQELLKERVERERKSEARRAMSRRATTGPVASDGELLEKARSAKNGDRFAALYDKGDLGAHGGDHSRADLALCIMLAFWTGGDEERIDQWFRGSALNREKWEAREDYRAATIGLAILSCRSFYSPQSRSRSGRPRVGVKRGVRRW